MGRTIAMIAAAAENNALGIDNDLLWHLPDDFKRFKQLTSGHKIIMGRKTLETFPKPLRYRTHIVITRDKNYIPKFSDCIVVHSMDEALKLTENDKLSFIIGGGEIYKLGLPYANKIGLTRIHATFDADTFFPEIDKAHWNLVEEVYHPKDESHQYDFTYLTYERI